MMKTAAGRIVTFYSYKGGTGRSMSLANAAWMLAHAGKKVLVIDWDLEAPGLHRYFRPFLVDPELHHTEGVIDFLVNFASEAATPVGKDEPLKKDWYVEHADILKYAVSLKYTFGDRGGGIDFIGPGRQCSTYAIRVNTFNWQNFYDRLGGWPFIEAMKTRLREEYDYILIDSRTGVSDTSGVCTVQLPDTVVLCFTLNNQSIEGVLAVARSIVAQRPDGVNLLPVPTRVESAEKEKLKRLSKRAQRLFQELEENNTRFKDENYWRQVAVPYVPFYAYEEVLASFIDEKDDPVNLIQPSEYLAGLLNGDKSLELAIKSDPSVRRNILAMYEGSTPAQTPASSSETGDPRTIEQARTWRKQVQIAMRRWVGSLYNQSDILSDSLLVEGAYWAPREPDLLNEQEKGYFQWSLKRRKSKNQSALLGGVSFLVIGLIIYGVFRFGSSLGSKDETKALFVEARELESKGNTAGALGVYSRALELRPSDPVLLFARASLQTKMDRRADAIRDLEASLDLDPGRRETYLLLAQNYRLQGNLAQSENSIRRAMTNGFSSAEIQEYLGQYLEELNRIDEAIDAYKKSKAQSRSAEKLATLYARRAELKVQAKALVEAIGDYGQAILANPSDEFLVSRRAELHVETQQWTPAITGYTLANELHPDRYKEGLAYALIERAEAIPMTHLEAKFPDLERSISLRATAHLWRAYLSRGMLYALKRDADRAIDDFKLAVLEAPQEKKYLGKLELGKAYALKGNWDSSIQSFSEVLTLGLDAKQRVPVLLGRGDSYFQSGKYTQAIADFQEVLANSPSNSQAYSSIALAYAKLGDHEKTIEALGNLINLDKSDPGPLILRGEYLLQSAKPGPEFEPRILKAIEDFREAVRINPKRADAFNLWGLALEKRNDVKGAIEKFRAALEADPLFQDAKANLERLEKGKK